MPQYNRAELGRMATESGFVRDTFEKVLRLKEILKFLNEDKFLREHLLLKGGTAINLTVFNLPRLSVDIDMDYTPNDTREDMLECRAKITDIIKEYMESEGYGKLFGDYCCAAYLFLHQEKKANSSGCVADTKSKKTKQGECCYERTCKTIYRGRMHHLYDHFK